MNNTIYYAPVQKRKKSVKKSIGIILCVLLGLFVISLAVVFPKSRLFVVELGDNLSASPSDYLFGYGFIVDRAAIDVEEVNTGKVGDYRGTARLFFYHYSFDVKVRDTTPPEITPFTEELYIATGREYAPENFADAISDLSGDVQCRIIYADGKSEKISFPASGHYSLSLEAEDASALTMAVVQAKMSVAQSRPARANISPSRFISCGSYSRNRRRTL